MSRNPRVIANTILNEGFKWAKSQLDTLVRQSKTSAQSYEALQDVVAACISRKIKPGARGREIVGGVSIETVDILEEIKLLHQFLTENKVDVKDLLRNHAPSLLDGYSDIVSAVTGGRVRPDPEPRVETTPRVDVVPVDAAPSVSHVTTSRAPAWTRAVSSDPSESHITAASKEPLNTAPGPADEAYRDSVSGSASAMKGKGIGIFGGRSSPAGKPEPTPTHHTDDDVSIEFKFN